MLAFAGSIDMPGLAMVFGPLLLVLLANRFSWQRFLIVGNQIILDIGLLFLVIASVGLLANQEDLFAFHLTASMALLTVVFALILKLSLQLLSGELGRILTQRIRLLSWSPHCYLLLASISPKYMQPTPVTF